MKNINNRGILLGLALLGATTFTASIPATAQPRRDVKAAKRDVKQARKEVRQERKDLRNADTARERRDAQRELRDAQRDLSRDRRDLRDERQENRPGYRPGTTFRPGYRPNTTIRPGYRPGTTIRPGYSQGANARTLEGTVINDLDGNDFTLRVSNGQIVRVLVPSGEPGALSRGDVVRVSGTYAGSTFNARTLSILSNR